MKRLKCWEFKGCGMDKTGGCPAFEKNHGHTCWRVAGTMCGGKVQGTFAQKLDNCKECNFYNYAKAYS
jgi:hypothetical protein